MFKTSLINVTHRAFTQATNSVTRAIGQQTRHLATDNSIEVMKNIPKYQEMFRRMRFQPTGHCIDHHSNLMEELSNSFKSALERQKSQIAARTLTPTEKASLVSTAVRILSNAQNYLTVMLNISGSIEKIMYPKLADIEKAIKEKGVCMLIHHGLAKGGANGYISHHAVLITEIKQDKYGRTCAVLLDCNNKIDLDNLENQDDSEKSELEKLKQLIQSGKQLAALTETDIQEMKLLPNFISIVDLAKKLDHCDKVYRQNLYHHLKLGKELNNPPPAPMEPQLWFPREDISPAMRLGEGEKSNLWDTLFEYNEVETSWSHPLVPSSPK